MAFLFVAIAADAASAPPFECPTKVISYSFKSKFSRQEIIDASLSRALYVVALRES